MRAKLTDIVFVIVFVVLVIGVMNMPTAATTAAPAYNDIINHYLEQGADETNAINIVAAILTDYRGFDTLGETIVLFTSVVAVSSVLRSARHDWKFDDDE